MCQGVRVSGCQDVRMSGCQCVRIPGCQDGMVSQEGEEEKKENVFEQSVRVSGCQSVRVSGCQGVRVSGWHGKTFLNKLEQSWTTGIPEDGGGGLEKRF